MELEALQAVLPEIESLGASLAVISPQLEKYSKQVVKKNRLTYPVLCDRSNKAASAFGLTFSLPEDLKALYLKFGIDLSRFNGNDDWQLAMPARYIIGSDGKISDSEINPDYTRRPEPEQLPELLKAL